MGPVKAVKVRLFCGVVILDRRKKKRLVGWLVRYSPGGGEDEKTVGASQ